MALSHASSSSSQAPTDDLADPELDRIGSDIEDGGLDLSLPFQPIGAYVDNKREMLDQCFHVLGEKKLRKMLPDELKVTETLTSARVAGGSEASQPGLLPGGAAAHCQSGDFSSLSSSGLQFRGDQNAVLGAAGAHHGEKPQPDPGR